MAELMRVLLLLVVIACAIAVSFSKNLLTSVVLYMSYSLVMAVIWLVLESPDLSVTEAAVGAGVTSILFFVVLKKIDRISVREDGSEDDES